MLKETVHMPTKWPILKIRDWCRAHHNEIVEEEDFSLVRRLFLRLVDVGDLKEATAAHQSPVRDGQDLQHRRDEGFQSLDGGGQGVQRK